MIWLRMNFVGPSIKMVPLLLRMLILGSFKKKKPFNQPGLPWHKIWDLRIQPRNKFLCGNQSKTACLTLSSSTKGKSSTLICAFYVIILRSSSSNPENAGIGGVIRNHKGDLVAAFAKNIGISTNNKAEVWAFQQGLKLAIELEITHLLIQTDSTFLLSCLNRKETHHSELRRLLDDAGRSIQKLEKATIVFCYRETNSVADLLAELGITAAASTTIYYDDIRPNIKKFLEMDLHMYYTRCTSDFCKNKLVLKM